MTPPRIYPEEWDRYKEVILELFPTLERAQLLEHLSRKYGFCPTSVFHRSQHHERTWTPPYTGC